MSFIPSAHQGQRAKTKRVKVVNPTPRKDGTPGNTSMRMDDALRNIRSNLAAWVNQDLGIIRICSDPVANVNLDVAVNFGQATLKQMRGLPMTGNIARFLAGKRAERR